MKQGSAEWFAARVGVLSASRVHDILPGKRGGYLQPRENLMFELLTERVTGRKEEMYQTPAMMHGVDTEPVARAVYEAKTGEIITEVGFIKHPTIPGLGASPDGILSDGLGGIEIKCPNTSTHIKTLATGVIKPQYISQCQLAMACTGRTYWIFMSFDDRVKPEHQAYMYRIERDQEAIEQIEHEAILFLAELKKLEEKIRGDK